MSSDGSRSDSKLIVLLFLAMTVPVGAGIYSLLLTKAPSSVSNAGFNVLKVEQSREPQYIRTAAAPSDPTSPMPLAGPLKLAPAGRAPAYAPAAGAPGAAAYAPPAASRQREKEFLARYGEQLRQYTGRLGRITNRYYRNEPVVREVDRAFGAMPRYMEVKQRFARDKDPFQFMRDAIALPEVRGEVSRRMKDPRVWRVSLGMILDTLKYEPPSKLIYNEAKMFVTQDQTMNNWMDGVTQDAFKYMPNTMEVLPPNADMGTLFKLVNDVNPAAGAMVSSTTAPLH